MGRGEVNLNFDTQKMGLWPGGLLSITGEGNFGSPLNSNTGAVLGTNANDLFPETEKSFVLPGVLYTQFLSEQFGISLGKFTTITSESGDMNEFAHGKGAKQFLNPAFNLNPATALTIPYSTLGIAGIFVPVKELVVTTSVLDPHGEPGGSGVNELFASGATLASEARYTTDFWGLTGHQLIGATYSTSRYTDLDQRVANLIFPQLPVQESNGSWSAFWNADQYLYQPDGASDRGVGVFGRYGISDGKANPIGHFLSFGVGGKGLIPGREHDGFGTGFFYSWTADNRITRQLKFEDAQGWEVYYEIALTPAVFLTPDIQWVQPSQSTFDSSLITGFRLNTVF
jgi:porin